MGKLNNTKGFALLFLRFLFPSEFGKKRMRKLLWFWRKGIPIRIPSFEKWNLINEAFIQVKRNATLDEFRESIKKKLPREKVGIENRRPPRPKDSLQSRITLRHFPHKVHFFWIQFVDFFMLHVRHWVRWKGIQCCVSSVLYLGSLRSDLKFWTKGWGVAAELELNAESFHGEKNDKSWQH